MLLRCPKCKNEFVQFLREPQTTNECRKCGAKIPLDSLARFEFSCVCGRSIPKLTWNPAKRCYTT